MTNRHLVQLVVLVLVGAMSFSGCTAGGSTGGSTTVETKQSLVENDQSDVALGQQVCERLPAFGYVYGKAVAFKDWTGVTATFDISKCAFGWDLVDKSASLLTSTQQRSGTPDLMPLIVNKTKGFDAEKLFLSLVDPVSGEEKWSYELDKCKYWSFSDAASGFFCTDSDSALFEQGISEVDGMALPKFSFHELDPNLDYQTFQVGYDRIWISDSMYEAQTGSLLWKSSSESVNITSCAGNGVTLACILEELSNGGWDQRIAIVELETGKSIFDIKVSCENVAELSMSQYFLGFACLEPGNSWTELYSIER